MKATAVVEVIAVTSTTMSRTVPSGFFRRGLASACSTRVRGSKVGLGVREGVGTASGTCARAGRGSGRGAGRGVTRGAREGHSPICTVPPGPVTHIEPSWTDTCGTGTWARGGRMPGRMVTDTLGLGPFQMRTPGTDTIGPGRPSRPGTSAIVIFGAGGRGGFTTGTWTRDGTGGLGPGSAGGFVGLWAAAAGAPVP
ncbi:MAG: hypothetical protein HOW59_28945, partial [Nonomuraea sp.]|nr:hypothetical protein [Nonomuraea sp.]